MYKIYFDEFFEEFEYPAEARKELLLNLEKITSGAQSSCFNKIVASYSENMMFDFKTVLDEMNQISSSLGINEYTGVMIILIALSKPLKSFYLQNGIEPWIWRNSMLDLKYKLNECMNMYGIWGTFAGMWFGGFYSLKRFGFGKLEFEVVDFGGEVEVSGVKLTPQTKVINVHIPHTGEPLGREDMLYSYTEAKKFYSNILCDGKAVFVCQTWLLFKKNKEILSPNSNLYKFISDYTIIKEGEYPDYKQCWRIFNTFELDDPDKLPQRTSLQKAYVGMMKKGEKTGWSYGVFIF